MTDSTMCDLCDRHPMFDLLLRLTILWGHDEFVSLTSVARTRNTAFVAFSTEYDVKGNFYVAKTSR